MDEEAERLAGDLEARLLAFRGELQEILETLELRKRLSDDQGVGDWDDKDETRLRLVSELLAAW